MTIEIPQEARRADAPVHSALFSGVASSRVLLPLFCIALDLGIVLASILMASGLRQRLPYLAGANDVDELVARLGVFMVAGWVGLLAFFGTYRTHQLSSGVEEYKNVVNSSAVTAGFVGIACYLGKVPALARLLRAQLPDRHPAPRPRPGSAAARPARARRRGLLLHRVLIAGDVAHIDEIASVLRRESWLGYRVVGALHSHDLGELETTSVGHPGTRRRGRGGRRGDPDAAPTSIFFAGGAFGARSTRCGALSLGPRAPARPGDRRAERHRRLQRADQRVRPVGGLPLMHLEPPAPPGRAPLGQAHLRPRRRRRLLLLLSSPLIAVRGLAIKRHDGGPVLFRQTRVGRDGRRVRAA